MVNPKPEWTAKQRSKTGAAGVSWLALVAATTLGTAVSDTFRARVSLDTPAVPSRLEGHSHRLVVQSYERSAIGESGMPARGARPLASLQRAVTSDELRRGIAVDIVQLQDRATNADSVVVVAWVERGDPDLEYDARTARPSEGAVYGVSGGAGPGIEVVLRQIT